jgi:H+/Cl- antiporter ClcA
VLLLGGGSRSDGWLTTARMLRLLCVAGLVGIGAGLGGMSLALLLHFVQHVAYGYSLDAVISRETFLEGVSAAAPLRRVVAMVICGIVAGVGWWALYRFGRPLVGVKRATAANDPRMPAAETTAHALLQIITVALGSPLGREVAPRELAAMLGGWLSHQARLTPEASRIMVACAAGAGLAAVYGAPWAGALFTLEVLLRAFNLRNVALAIGISAIAAWVARIGLGGELQYTVPDFSLSSSLVCWSIVVGPVLGFGAHWYRRLTDTARARAPRDRRLIGWCLVTFAMIGVLAIPFPQLLGNGKGPSQLDFANELGIGMSATLLVLKVVASSAALRAGAEGGLLTPGLTIGAMLGSLLGGLWDFAWTGVPLGAFAMVGGTAFLAASLQMPLTAIVLMAEFTHEGSAFLIPIALAVAGSMMTLRACARRFDRAAAQRAAVTAETRAAASAIDAQPPLGMLDPVNSTAFGQGGTQ